MGKLSNLTPAENHSSVLISPYPSTKHQAPSTKHQAPSTKHQAPSTKRPSAKYQDELH